MTEILYQLTTEDAEAVLSRPLKPGEASSIRKTLESVLAEDAAYALESHRDDATD